MLDGVKALENIKQVVDLPKPSCWSRLQDAAGSMDASQTSFVMSQDSVKLSYKELMDSFNSFLFERFKEEFASVPTFQPIINKYIDSVIQSAQDYGKHTVEIEEENRRLKKELEDLKNANRH